MPNKLTPERLARMQAGRIAVRPSLAVRFWSKVDKRGPDECWNWIGSLNPCGYGQIWEAPKIRRAHQVSWEFAGNGAAPRWPMVLDHICRNTKCVNPAHLRIVAQVDNVGKYSDNEKRRASLKAAWKRKRANGTHLRKPQPASMSAVSDFD